MTLKIPPKLKHDQKKHLGFQNENSLHTWNLCAWVKALQPESQKTVPMCLPTGTADRGVQPTLNISADVLSCKSRWWDPLALQHLSGPPFCWAKALFRRSHSSLVSSPVAQTVSRAGRDGADFSPALVPGPLCCRRQRGAELQRDRLSACPIAVRGSWQQEPALFPGALQPLPCCF